jgi:hypothetical protein
MEKIEISYPHVRAWGRKANMEYFATKQWKTIVKATFPDYRKHKVAVKTAEKIMFSGVNWSGGSKSEYRACTIDGRPLENMVDMGMAAPWENPYEGLWVNIPPGMVVVEGGFFCGKKMMLRITVNPGDRLFIVHHGKKLLGE